MWKTSKGTKSAQKDVDAVVEDDKVPGPGQDAVPSSTSAGDTRNAPATASISNPDVSNESARGGLAYDGTELKVTRQARNTDSVISLFSDEGVDEDDEDDDRHSDDRSDDSSELTALASRPRYSEDKIKDTTTTLDSLAESAVEGTEPVASSTTSLEQDDMVTPGLHTAAMASLHFGHHYNTSSSSNSSISHNYTTISRPTSSSNQRSSAPHSPRLAPPMTLASYLSSTLSSPKTRSLSSSSLASFPTDLLSDISRSESVADTDDGRSEEFNSDGDPSSSIAQLPPASPSRPSRRSRYEDHLLQDSSGDLIMPRLAPSTAGSHDGSSPSDSSDKASPAPPLTVRRQTRPKQTSCSSNATISANPISMPRILIAGGTNKQQSKLRAALLRQGRTISDADVRSASNDYQDNIESVGSLAAAGERVERPFTVLQTVLRPELPTTDASLLEHLLPNLLDQVAAVSVCLLILDVDDCKKLAQHVLDNFKHIYELSKYTALVPILVESENEEGRDSVSQLIQGNIDWLGRDKDGRIASLKAKARPYHISDLEGLAPALAAHNFNAQTVKAFQRWNAPLTVPPSRPRGRHSPKLRRSSSATGSRPISSSSSSGDSEQSKNGAADSQSQKASSLTPSMLESVSVPPSSLPSGLSDSSELQKNETPTGHRRNRNPCPGHSQLDPLHLPSLLRLVGLNLAASFTSFASTVKAMFRQSEKSEEDTIRALLDEDEQRKSGRSKKQKTNIPPTVKPFYGCCRWRYTLEGEGYYEDDKSKCQRCAGIVLAGVVIGVALWFS